MSDWLVFAAVKGLTGARHATHQDGLRAVPRLGRLGGYPGRLSGKAIRQLLLERQPGKGQSRLERSVPTSGHGGSAHATGSSALGPKIAGTGISLSRQLPTMMRKMRESIRYLLVSWPTVQRLAMHFEAPRYVKVIFRRIR
jgi:hypothetical protein